MVPIQVQRDRDGTFRPSLIRKHQRQFAGFDDRILAMYARGVNENDVREHLEELYGTEANPLLVAAVSDAVLEGLRIWQERALEAVYCVVYLEAILLRLQIHGTVQNRRVCVAVGLPPRGNRQLLGLWTQHGEGKAFCLGVFRELRHRGVREILVLSAEGLPDAGDALKESYPEAIAQGGLVHVIRSPSSHRADEAQSAESMVGHQWHGGSAPGRRTISIVHIEIDERTGEQLIRRSH